MDRIQEIIRHPKYQFHIEEIRKAEADRIFCLHDMSHFLDVARIAMILNQEEHLEIPKDIVYATGLLHDIGRAREYQDGTAHEMESARLAPAILKDTGFTGQEIERIVKAIADHRTKEIASNQDLSGIIYRADKASRPCFACAVCSMCKWPDAKKNLRIIY